MSSTLAFLSYPHVYWQSFDNVLRAYQDKWRAPASTRTDDIHITASHLQCLDLATQPIINTNFDAIICISPNALFALDNQLNAPMTAASFFNANARAQWHSKLKTTPLWVMGKTSAHYAQQLWQACHVYAAKHTSSKGLAQALAVHSPAIKNILLCAGQYPQSTASDALMQACAQERLNVTRLNLYQTTYCNISPYDMNRLQEYLTRSPYACGIHSSGLAHHLAQQQVLQIPAEHGLYLYTRHPAVADVLRIYHLNCEIL